MGPNGRPGSPGPWQAHTEEGALYSWSYARQVNRKDRLCEREGGHID